MNLGKLLKPVRNSSILYRKNMNTMAMPTYPNAKTEFIGKNPT